MKLSDETSGNLRALAFLCALLVVPIHCWSEAEWFAGASAASTFEVAVKLLFSCSVSRIAVPFFFVLTGFFLALGYMNYMESRNTLNTLKGIFGWYVQTLKKRAFTIYLPFVIWNALNVALCLAFGKEGYGEMGIAQLSAKVFGWNLYERIGCSQFWYLQTVILWVILSPVAILLLRRIVIAVPLTLFLAWGWAVNLMQYPHPLAIGNFLWLSMGTMAAFWLCENGTTKHTKYTKKWVRVMVALVFGIAVVGRIVAGLCRDKLLYDIFDKCLIAFGLLTVFLNADGIARLLGRLRSLWGLSFFIYAIHSMIISVVVIAISRFGVSSFVGYSLKLMVATVGAIGTGYLLRQRMPRCFAVLTGGRGV